MSLTDSRLVFVEAQFPFQVSPCKLCDKPNDTGTGSLLLMSSNQCHTVIFTYTLHLPEGQTSEAWEPPEKECSSQNREALEDRVLSVGIWRVKVLWYIGLCYIATNCNVVAKDKL